MTFKSVRGLALICSLFLSQQVWATTDRVLHAMEIDNFDTGGKLKIPSVTPTAGRACVWDASSIPASSSVTTTELGYLSGATSSIQTQLGLLAPLNSPALTGTPTVPTAAVGDSSNTVASTNFVYSQGFLTSTGAIPTGAADNATGQTSASTTFVNALTTTVTLTQTAPIFVAANATFTTASSASVAGLRVTVNGTASRVALLTLTATATNYLGAVQYTSAALAPGTYTVNFDFQRNSGTGTTTYVSGTLEAYGLQGTNSNGITKLTGDVTAGPGSGSQAATIAAAAVTGAKIASATITGANIAATTITNSNISTVDASKITTGTLPVARGGTGLTSIPVTRVPFGGTSGTILATDANMIYDTTNGQFSVGGSGTARINAVVASGSKTALQAFNSSGGNGIQSTNVSAWTAALINRSASALTGASIDLEFGRGTPSVPTQALNGDQVGVIAATPDANDGFAHGYSGIISFLAAEDATTTATGGDIVLAPTPTGNIVPVEQFRLTSDGKAKFKSGVMLDTSASQPSCDSAHRGTMWLVQGGAGVADILQVCMKDAADAYSWVTK